MSICKAISRARSWAFRDSYQTAVRREWIADEDALGMQEATGIKV